MRGLVGGRRGWRIVMGVLASSACSYVGAHAFLAASEPPPHSSLSAVPREIRLRFSEPVESAFIDVAVQCDAMSLALDGKPVLDTDGKTVRARLDLGAARATSKSQCVVDWRIVARDGHANRGKVPFRIEPR